MSLTTNKFSVMGKPNERPLSPQAMYCQVEKALLKSGWDLGHIKYRKPINGRRVYKHPRYHGSESILFEGIPMPQKPVDEPDWIVIEPRRPDIVLYNSPHLPMAIIQFVEPGETFEAAINKALSNVWQDGRPGLEVYCAYATDGQEVMELDIPEYRLRQFPLKGFPSPYRLYNYCAHLKRLTPSQFCKLNTACNIWPDRWPSYYESLAIQKTVEAIMKHWRRMSLVIGTSGSHFFIASYVMYLLWEARLAKCFLYLGSGDGTPSMLSSRTFRPFYTYTEDPANLPQEEEYQPYLVFLPPSRLPGAHLHLPANFFDLVFVEEYNRPGQQWATCQHLLGHLETAVQIGMSIHRKAPRQAAKVPLSGQEIFRFSIEEAIHEGFLAS